MPFAEDCIEHLWGGSQSSKYVLAYLRWRGLQDRTIKAARLGFLSRCGARNGGPCDPPSVSTIPWIENRQIQFMRFRKLDTIITQGPLAERKGEQRYFQVFRPRRPPTPGSARSATDSHSPSSRASWRRCWSARSRKGSGLRSRRLGIRRPDAGDNGGRGSGVQALRGVDADPTGNEAASRWESHWPGRFERITPPAGKDWTEAHQKKIYLRGFWQEVFAGLHRLRERFPMATTHGLLTYSRLIGPMPDERPFLNAAGAAVFEGGGEVSRSPSSAVRFFISKHQDLQNHNC